MDITIFSKQTGEILCQHSCPDGYENKQETGIQGYIEGFYDGNIYYVDLPTKEIKERTNMSFISLNKAQVAFNEKVILTNTPYKCNLQIEGIVNKVIEEIEDSIIELLFDCPGIYLLTIKKFPYLDWQVKITVV